MSLLKVGEKFYAKDTDANAACHVRAGDRGWVAHVDSTTVSFEIERRGRVRIEACCPLDVFAANFMTAETLAKVGEKALIAQCADGFIGLPWQSSAYVRARHFPKRYP